MPIRVCAKCGKEDEVVRVRPNLIHCMSCSAKLRTKAPVAGYVRVCDTCGDEKTFIRRPASTKCKGCSMKKEFFRVCEDCGDKRKVRNAQQASCKRCRSCSAKHRLLTIPMPPLKHIRICPHCPEDNNTKQVRSAVHAGIRPCMKHKFIDTPDKKYNVKPRAKKGKSVKNMSEASIKKVQETNRKHKEQVAIAEANKVAPKLSKEEEEVLYKKLVAEFLKDNEPSVMIPHNEPFTHVQQTMKL